jgi:two-component system, NtrC family, C4-dicarboxylate transport response regulator DctD
MMMPSVILIDDDEAVLEAYAETLELGGFSVTVCRSLAEARPHLQRDMLGAVLTDVKMPGRDGFAALSAIHAVDRDIPVVLFSGHADIPMALQAMRQGAYDFVEKPADPAYIVALLKRASEHRKLVLEHRALQGTIQSRAIDGRIIGNSHAIIRLREMVLALAQVDATILIQGETGTGKELVARSLHDFGPRTRAPFVAINCAALPQSIIESELFGHEVGAFTGAKERRVGKIELAHQGTLFLDEIESMPMEAQLRLLRVLQERRFERLGGNREIAVDIRVIAATKSDLLELARKGQFREDLVYRLNVVPLATPSLRARGPADIELLFRQFFNESAAKAGNRAAGLPDIGPLLQHDWPGNVRELRNAAERAALGFPALGGEVLPVHTQTAASLHAGISDLAGVMAAHEKREIESALARGHKLQETASQLGISRKTLYLKMREYGLSVTDEHGE